jgi:outer membrane lipoprotein SlyB
MAAPLTSCSLDDTGMTQVQGSALGALGGAALGGAIGLAVGGDTKSVVAGAVAGGLLGAVAGLQWANSIVKEKAAYANMEDYVNDNIKQLDSRTAEAKKTNAKLSKQVASLKAQNKKVDAAEINKQKEALAANLALIDNDIKVANDAAKEASGAKRSEIIAKVEALNAEKKAYEKNNADLAALASM